MDQRWLDELREFISIPSVSADPAHQDDLRRAAEWVRDFVKRAGGEAELVPKGTRDLVIGDIPASTNGTGAPTVMIYGHFDVQPPAPLELWESPPFELDEREGWLYARGIADDKGQLYTLLKAAELLHADGALPVNIRVACDGEEEIGGHSIVEFLEEDERGADACIIFDGGMTRPEQPDVIADAAERLFRNAVPKDANVTIERENSAPPGVFAPDSPAIQLGLEAFERAVGVRPILVRVGGTLPIYPALAEKGIPTIGTGFALRESNVHSPNERLRVEDVDRAVAAATELYKALAALG